MNSPIVLLIIWGLINIFVKSANDKKKIEDSKRKRIQKINNQRRYNKESNYSNQKETTSDRNIIEYFKEELERGREAQRSFCPEPLEEFNKFEKIHENEEVKKEEELIIEQSEFDEIPDTSIKEIKKDMSKSIEKASKNNNLNFKKDILKAIIYSEILSEPKSLKNMKKKHVI
jgi:hypothetical protein